MYKTIYLLFFIMAVSPFGCATRLSESTPARRAIHRDVIGKSYLGAPIEAVRIQPEQFSKTILIVFAVHGFEDDFDRDGQILVEVAENLIQYFSLHRAQLHNTRLIIVPCANPDGTYKGETKDGFGRCNAQGIDINRDFDWHWIANDSLRHRTSEKPFATPEARALRDLVLKEKPDIVLDIHGWLDCTYGDNEVARHFNDVFGFKTNPPRDPEKPMRGYFAGWSSQHARSVLVEYPMSRGVDYYTSGTLHALKTLSAHLGSD